MPAVKITNKPIGIPGDDTHFIVTQPELPEGYTPTGQETEEELAELKVESVREIEMDDMVELIQDKLDMDVTPTTGSSKLVTSGGIKTALDAADAEIGELKEKIIEIEPELSDEAKIALLECFSHVAWIDEHGQDYYNALEGALNGGEILSISARFAQGNHIFTPTDELEELRQCLTVTAVYNNHSKEVTGYVLSGNLNNNTSTITVQYSGKTTTFAVSVTFPPNGYTIKNYVTANGTQYINTGISETELDGKFTRTKVSCSETIDRVGHIFSSYNYFSPYFRYFGGSDHRGMSFNWYGDQTYTSFTTAELWDVDVPSVIESFKDNKITVDGNDVYLCEQGTTKSTEQTMMFFTYGGNPTDTRYRFYGNFYYYKIYNTDGTKTHDFIPCVNSSNVVGLYDLISGTFYAPTVGTLVAN